MLNVHTIERAHASNRTQELADINGLSLLVYPTGRKVWFLRYVDRKGKRRGVSIGDYPKMTLKAARLFVSEYEPEDNSPSDACAAVSFRDVAMEWYDAKSHAREYSTEHLRNITYRLDRYIFPNIGKRPISEISRPSVVGFLTDIAGAGKSETARRCAVIVQQVFLYALDRGYIESNPTACLSRSLPPGAPVKHFAHCETPAQIGALMNAIHRVQSPQTRTALLLAAYCFPRCGELLKSTLDEFDFDAALWTIPAEHTKRRRALCVPLAPQVMKALKGYITSEGRAKGARLNPESHDTRIPPHSVKHAI